MTESKPSEINQPPASQLTRALTTITLTMVAFSSGTCAWTAENAAPKLPHHSTSTPAGNSPTGSPTFRVGEQVLPSLNSYCYSCHDADVQKSDVRLDNLESLSLDARLDLLNRMQEQIFIGEMPPKKKKQPTEAERKQALAWISQALGEHGASKLEDKLRKPEYGNLVDHDQLFSGKFQNLPGYTPDRRWLISEFIFNAKFNRLLGHVAPKDIDGKRQQLIGSNRRNGVNLTNPFLLPPHSGVRYYDTTMLDGGHLLTMLNNAREAAAFLLSQTKKSNTLPAFNKIMATEWEHEKIVAARKSYLNGNIEPLLRELYQDKHDALLPVYVASKPEPSAGTDAQGKPLKKPVFDTAVPSRDDLNEIWNAMRRNSPNGEKRDEALITVCEREWFISGVNDQNIRLRVNFMRTFMDELFKRMPKTAETKAPKPPADAELAIIRAALQKHRQAGDTYAAIIAKCTTSWADEFTRERLKEPPLTDTTIADLVDLLFVKIIERSPTAQEKADYSALTKSYIQQQGKEKAFEKLIQTFILCSEFVYRSEFGIGQADEHGRKMLSPRDASYAIAYALTDSSPDKQLVEAANSGRLNTREDYRREVLRLLKVRDHYYMIDEAVDALRVDSFTTMPIRKVRFFREFFGYPAMLPIFKDNKRFGGNYTNVTGRLVAAADMLVEHILDEDRHVFEQLLSTEEFYVYHSGDNAAMAAATERIRKVYDYFQDKDWENFDAEKLTAHVPFLKENPMPGLNLDAIGKVGGRSDQVKIFQGMMTDYTQRLGKGATVTAPYSSVFGVPSAANTRTGYQLGSGEEAKAFSLEMVSWNYPTAQPAKMEHRKGLLTHPAWLIAFAGNTATDPVRRGKWVREKLLAGNVPDTPVTVDAVIPEDHHQTLRNRLAKVTEVEYCWKCHERMNPLGNSFEMYDDFGRYRTEESLEHPDNLIKKMPDKGAPHMDLRDIYKTLPVNAKGRLDGTGDPKLDGEITDAIDLAERLAKSSKVRQSIIRHAFRYFMGRNETLSDSKTLIDADQAYLQSGGSFDAVIVSLLTSDSFIYRKPLPN
jgi:Protein of unknown function (DUF1588)/Protein of unknown function (DUF1592)/Protein of unknown function (DUF1585)